MEQKLRPSTARSRVLVVTLAGLGLYFVTTLSGLNIYSAEGKTVCLAYSTK